MTDFHFLRPWWLFAMLLLFGLLWSLWRQSPRLDAWAQICDSHLLKHQMQARGQGPRRLALLCLFFSAFAMCIALAGPTWFRLPVPTYKQIQPRVIVLDLSMAMLANDLKPDRLTRAKFKLHDLFKRRVGQLGLIAYTSEPFVVSPLTDDAKTIDALLSSLTPEIMPVEGQNLSAALKEAAKLIANAGFQDGEILVLTGETPSLNSKKTAASLSKKHIRTSIMPVRADKSEAASFQEFAKAGHGSLIPFSDRSVDLDLWLNASTNQAQFKRSNDDEIPQWRDEGPWFLIPALILLLPVFRRGWLQRITA